MTIGVKMIGGATASKIKVQESTNGLGEFSDVQELTISGKQNEIKTLATTDAFAPTTRVVKLLFNKGSNVGIGPISISAATATITSAGYATWYNITPASFPSSVTAYLVKAIDGQSDMVQLEDVSDVPANTPVLLRGAAGTYTVNTIASSTTSTTGNRLHVSTGTNPEGDMYVLSKPNETDPVGFYLWQKTVNNEENNLPAGKIYLELPSGSSARSFIALPGEQTGISNVYLDGNLDGNLNHNVNLNGNVYDLQGRRVMQPTKGLYIVNGKKIVIK